MLVARGGNLSVAVATAIAVATVQGATREAVAAVAVQAAPRQRVSLAKNLPIAPVVAAVQAAPALLAAAREALVGAIPRAQLVSLQKMGRLRVAVAVAPVQPRVEAAVTEQTGLSF
jgi:hypothetical protein